MNKQQLRTRVFGAFLAGVFAFGATSFASEVQSFDSADEAFAAESQDFSEMMNGAGEEASVEASADAFGHGHHPYPHNRGRFVCVAQNMRGHVFYGRDRFQYQAQQEALSNCYRARSISCAVTHCAFVR